MATAAAFVISALFRHRWHILISADGFYRAEHRTKITLTAVAFSRIPSPSSPAPPLPAAASPSAAERSLCAFLQLAGAAGKPGIQKNAAPLVKNLWFEYQRKRAMLEWLLSRHCRKLRNRERSVMSWALLECYCLDGLPPAIAVAVAVGYLRRLGDKAGASFVNAVLRNILGSCPALADVNALAEREAPPPVQCGLPPVLYRRWLLQHGPQWVQTTAALLQTGAPICARPRGSFRNKCGISLDEAMALLSCVPADAFPDPAQYYIQDPSTLLAPLLLAAKPGEMLADLCAAPGGKALILAEQLNGTGTLLAADRSEARLRQLHENLDSFGNVTVTCGDAAAPPPEWRGRFDALLLDVPCTNSGVLRRRPDARWSFSESKLRELVALQQSILEGAIAVLKPSGRMVYSTCSIEEEEGRLQTANFLRRHPEFRLAEEHQLFPSPDHDGAYAALLIRSAPAPEKP